MIAFVRRILFVMLRAADGNHFIIAKTFVPYIQKVGKMNKKQEISTLMEKKQTRKRSVIEMLTIQERLGDLRAARGLNYEQLAEETGLSKSALQQYENNEFKDISHFAILKLAKYYGVTTDYLLGLSETKKHSTDDINSLRLSDELIDILQHGKINVPLFCELASHKDFPKLLADIELYANRFASKAIEFLNAFVDTGREQIIQKSKPIQPDHFLDMLSDVQIDEGNYFDRRIHDDLDAIVKDIREAHKNRSESALDDPNYDPVTIMTKTLDELQNFKGSELEKRVFIFCKSNGIIYSKLTDEEKIWLTRIIQKSKKVQSAVSQRGKK